MKTKFIVVCTKMSQPECVLKVNEIILNHVQRFNYQGSIQEIGKAAQRYYKIIPAKLTFHRV